MFSRKKISLLIILFVYIYVSLLLIWQIRSTEPLCFRGSIITPPGSTTNTVLSSGESVDQTIVVPPGTYHGILLQLEGDGEGTATVSVSDENNTQLWYVSIPLDQLDSSFRLVGSSSISFSKDSTLIITFSCLSADDGHLTVATNMLGGCVPYRLVYHVLDINLFSFSLVLLLLIMYLAIHVIILSKRSFEIKFFCVFLLLGILFSLSLPPLDGPDELSHFLRVIEISQGHFITSDHPTGPSNILPNYYNSTFIPVRYYLSHLSDRLDFANPQSMLFQNTSVYSPVTYLPQALGAFLIRLFSDNKLLVFYAIRFANLISVATILYFSIKYLPQHKAWMAAISLLPPVIQGACTVSADGLPFALCCAMISLVLKIRNESRLLSKREVLLLYAVSILLGQCKIVYVTFCLLLLLIPKDLFKSQTIYYKHVATLVCLLIITSLGWTAFASRYLVYPMNEGVNTPAQLSSILHNPIRFLWICIMTFFSDDGRIWYQIFGSYLGWQTVYIGKAILLPLIGWSFVCLFWSSSSKENKKALLIYAITILLTIGATITSLYIQFTPFGSGTVIGIQGRYFLPVLFLVGEIVYSSLPRQNKSPISLNSLLEGSSLLSCSAIIYMLVQTF